MTKQELMETYTAEQLAEMVVEFQSGKENKVFKVSDDKNYQNELEEFLKESPIQSTIERICRDITDQKNNAMAMEFTRVICELLRVNGVYVHCTETKFSEKITENSIEENYGIKFDSVDFTEHDKKFADEIEKLQSKVEKYRKAFEDAKKERDCKIAEYQKKIEELYNSLRTLEGNLKVSNVIIENTIKNENGEETNTVKFEGIKQFAEYIKCFYTVNTDYIQKVLQGHEQKQDTQKAISDFLPTEPIKVADILINASKKRTNCMTGKEYDKYIFDKWQLRQIAEHLLVYCNHNGEVEEC